MPKHVDMTTEQVQTAERDTWSEAKFTAKVIRLAQDNGWRVAHFRPAKTAKGWRTAVQGDGKGFPDLVMIRGAKMVIAELKIGKGKITPEQAEWLLAFNTVLYTTVGSAVVWRPSDWKDIVWTLESREEQP